MMVSEPKLTDEEWDPHPRKYLRRASDGQKAWLIHRDGKRWAKLDRPTKETLVPYRENDWILADEERPLRPPDVAKMTLAADKALCRTFGMHDEANREWLDMKDEARRDWIECGPEYGARKERVDLWAGIMAAMHPHTQSK